MKLLKNKKSLLFFGATIVSVGIAVPTVVSISTSKLEQQPRKVDYDDVVALFKTENINK